MPNGSTVLVIAIGAAAVGFCAASLMAAVRGDHFEETATGRHRGAAVVVALGYLTIAAIIIYTVYDAAH